METCKHGSGGGYWKPSRVICPGADSLPHEVEEAKDGSKYLIIHTGSRNLGKQVAEIYQRLAIALNKGKDYYLEQRDLIIKKYKEEGRANEIQDALEELVWTNKETTIPEDLCFLFGKYLED